MSTSKGILIFNRNAVNNRFFLNNDHLVAELSRRIAIRMGPDKSLI